MNISEIKLFTKKEYDYYKQNSEIAKKEYDLIVSKDEIDDSIYCEVHHKIPRCKGGTDDLDNKVKLKYADHLRAHLLLSCIYPDDLQFVNTISLMIHNSNNEKFSLSDPDFVIDFDVISEIRTSQQILAFRDRIGSKKSEQTIANMRVAHSGERNHNYGKSFPDDYKNWMKLVQSKRVQFISPTGNTYYSYKEAGKSMGIYPDTFGKWFRAKRPEVSGWTMKILTEEEAAKVKEELKRNPGREIKVTEEIKTFSDAPNFAKPEAHTVMVEDNVTLSVTYPDGSSKTYPTYGDAARDLGLKTSDFKNRLKANNLPGVWKIEKRK